MSNEYVSMEAFQAESVAFRTTITEMLRSPDNNVNWKAVSEKAKSMVAHHGQNTLASQQHIENIISEFQTAYSGKKQRD